MGNDQVKAAAKKKKKKKKKRNAKIFVCELWVKRVGAFGVVLYRNQ